MVPGSEDGGADECDALADGDPEPSGCPGRRLTGTGGIGVLDPDRAGVKNAFGETRADAGGADEDNGPGLAAGLDDAAEDGVVATAPAPASVSDGPATYAVASHDSLESFPGPGGAGKVRGRRGS